MAKYTTTWTFAPCWRQKDTRSGPSPTRKSCWPPTMNGEQTASRISMACLRSQFMTERETGCFSHETALAKSHCSIRRRAAVLLRVEGAAGRFRFRSQNQSGSARLLSDDGICARRCLHPPERAQASACARLDIRYCQRGDKYL